MIGGVKCIVVSNVVIYFQRTKFPYGKKIAANIGVFHAINQLVDVLIVKANMSKLINVVCVENGLLAHISSLITANEFARTVILHMI